MKYLRRLAIGAVLGIVLIIVLATTLQPYLPWLIILFVLACIFKIALRD